MSYTEAIHKRAAIDSQGDAPTPTLNVVKLADHFGQYVISIKCECGHGRQARPQTFAALAGWDALLADVVRRLRCSRCGERKCSATVRPETKRDG